MISFVILNWPEDGVQRAVFQARSPASHARSGVQLRQQFITRLHTPLVAISTG